MALLGRSRDPKLLAAIDGVTDQELVKAIAGDNGQSASEVERSLIDLSIASRVFADGVTERHFRRHLLEPAGIFGSGAAQY